MILSDWYAFDVTVPRCAKPQTAGNTIGMAVTRQGVTTSV